MTAVGTMMALRAHARGGPEQLVYEPAPLPSAGPGEVLIAVHAAAITFAELTWDLEWTTRDGQDRTPVIPSHEVSGVVTGLGAGVAGRAVGDEVIGLVDFDRDGAAAEYVVMPAASLAAKPRSLSHVEAATLPLAALTAWQALADHAVLQPGEQVLIQGGAGGVGLFAVQLAAILGGRVTATGHSVHAALVEVAGAEHFISAGDGQPGPAAGGFDVVIDTVGGAVLDRSYGLLRPGGRLVTLSAPPDQARADRNRIRAVFFIVQPNADELARLAEMTDTGRLHTVISQTFPLAEGRKAFESGRTARPLGKTVIVVR
jgi:NADPH:quinone reductase-like Zn-dependent oxidoreductase